MCIRDSFYIPDEKGNLVPRMKSREKDAEQYINEKEQEVVSWVYQNNKHAGATTDTLPGAKCLYLAVRGRKEALAVAGIVMGADELTAFERSLLLAMLNEDVYKRQDESCASVYGYASGQASRDGLEDSEELEIVLADREEVRRILREENVAIMTAYMLMHFLHDDEPFAFLKEI